MPQVIGLDRANDLPREQSVAVMERHVSVEFGIEGMPVLHYRAEESAATEFAAEMRRLRPTGTVSVDDCVTGEMEPLPCQRLYRRC
ncbi:MULTISPECIES: hypothetical protein [Nocardia]|nr:MULTISPECIES: hypothetical protein [Nocardia]